MVRGVLAAISAVGMAITLTAGPALALASDSTPAPTQSTPPAAVPARPCPPGSTPTQPPGSTPTQLTGLPPNATLLPNATLPPNATQPDGGVLTTTCAVAPPTPFPGPSISPADTVGGPQLAGAGILVNGSPSVPAPPVVTDVSYVISDLTTGDVLAAMNPHALLPPASTLKTLTTLVTMPVLSPTTVVTATPEEVAADGTRVGMVEGSPYTVDQLFTGLILASGNDAAYALADAYGGRAKTLAAMNQRAQDLGAWDTVAKDPSGLDTDGQQSSAYDLSLFGRAVMQLPEFRRYAALRDVTFPGGTERGGKVHPPFQIANHNTLLAHYPGTIGVKNGHTSGARYTFIGAVTRGERTLLITEMGGVAVPNWQPTAALLDWAFANAGQLQPVGRLVAPGAPQPPEWRGEASTPHSSTPPAIGPGGPGSKVGGGPPLGAAGPTPPPPAAAGKVTSTQTVAGRPATYAVPAVALAALAGWVLARRRRRRSA